MSRARSSETAIRSPAEPLPKTPELLSGELLSAVSHDLRNPLGTIVLGSTLLLNQLAHEPHARRPLEMIQRSATKIETILELVSDIAALQNGQLELEWEEVSSCDLIKSALGPKSLDHACEDVTLHGDRRRLGRVLELAFNHAAEPVRVHVERTGAQVQIIVASAAWRTVDEYMARSIIGAHGGELWTEGDSIFITLPES